MNKRNKIYWSFQLAGWGLYVLVSAVLSSIVGEEQPKNSVFIFPLVFVLGIGLSHLHREIIKKYDWIKLNLLRLTPRIIASSIVSGLLFQPFLIGAEYLLVPEKFEFKLTDIILNLFGWGLLMVMWSLIYITYHYFENFRKEEIKNLRWQAANFELELNKLKSQLNPHFLFNSLNTIKALIDENPEKARKNVIQLSNLLRFTMLMGKNKIIPFTDEMKVVEDYIGLEESRLEDRLKVKIDIEEQAWGFFIPPMILQTLVENAIKHGISKKVGGGLLSISAKVVDSYLHIQVENDGELIEDTTPNGTGLGLSGTKERLKLLYSKDDLFSIESKEHKVVAKLIIPKEIKTHDKDHNSR